MKFSESWLRTWVEPELSTEELVAQLTMAGLEVDGVEPAAEAFSGVVVGEILSAEQHPDADKLRVCLVKGHPEGDKQVVCGAPNARVGIKIPFATVGAVLPGNFKIKKAKLRGVESFGMLCGQTELKAGDDDSGLWELPSHLEVGADVRSAMNLDDQIIEVDLTPNRGDCLGMQGLAREVAALNGLQAKALEFSPVQVSSDQSLSITLSAAEACPRYFGRVISGLDISVPTPQWMLERLTRSDVRSIDVVVDVTNYVLLELGQPMHAFDLDKLSGGINVRWAQEGEAIKLLDGSEQKLKSDTLVIADEQQALAMAGIMGGEASAVSSSTQNILLESAYFDAKAIAGRARNYGLHTDSSHRFERGVDFNLQAVALERASALLIEICGGKAGPILSAESEQHLPKIANIVLKKAQLARALGLQLEDEQVLNMLTGLGLVLQNTSEQAWEFAVPSYRFDLRVAADLVEEIARIYGYDKLPTRNISIEPQLARNSETINSLQSIKRHMASRDFQEVITYSFIDPKLHQSLFDDQPSVALMNPISADLSNMRTSLLPGLMDVLLKNINRQQNRVRIFEAGLCFKPGDNTKDLEQLQQDSYLGGLIYGPVQTLNWSEKARPVDFYDLKGEIEAIAAYCLAGKAYEISAPTTERAWMHPGQSAELSLHGQCIGYFGALHPLKQKALGIDKPVFVFELALSGLAASALPKYTSISKFPAVSRDLAFVVDQNVPYVQVQKIVAASAGQSLKSVTLFDIFKGDNIGEGKQSMALSLTYQEIERTLKDEEINASIEQVLNSLQTELGATLR